MPNPSSSFTAPTMPFFVTFTDYSVLREAIIIDIRREVAGLSSTARYMEVMANRPP